MIHLKPIEGLFAIAVPKDSFCFHKNKDGTIGHMMDNKRMGSSYIEIDMAKGKYELLGTCTKDEIDFDCFQLVETDIDISSNKRHELVKEIMFKDYEDDRFSTIITSEASFRSLLSANGIFFENSMKEPDIEDYSWGDDAVQSYRKDLAAWQQAQAKVLDKVVIIKQVK